MTIDRTTLTRRGLIAGAAAGGAALSLGYPPRVAIAQGAPIKIGFMLPYSGTFAQLGRFIDDGFRLLVAEKGGKLGGRAVEFVTLDDQSDPAKAPENMTRLVSRDKVDMVVGTVHSGVAMGMVKVARDTNALLMIPNAGAGAATGPLCAPNIFRSSFSNWQPAFPMGKVAWDKGHKTAVAISWKYGAGEESIGGFTEGFVKAGGKILDTLYLPFPNVEFQALLTRIAELKPDCVYCFFAGGGAVKFIKDYEAAGLRRTIPLYSVFTTEGTLPALGSSADGLLTTMHYADDLKTPRDDAFRAAFKKATNNEADVYAVQGYDAAQIIAAGVEAVKGDLAARDALVKAMETATIDSPRGKFTLSKSHNPVQDIYLREVKNGINSKIGVAHAALADPSRGCSLNQA